VYFNHSQKFGDRKGSTKETFAQGGGDEQLEPYGKGPEKGGRLAKKVKGGNRRRGSASLATNKVLRMKKEREPKKKKNRRWDKKGTVSHTIEGRGKPHDLGESQIWVANDRCQENL